MKKTKNNKILIEKIDTSKIYDPIEAIKVLKENSYTKFEESIEVAINLGIDSNKTDQNIRGVINLPKGTGSCAFRKIYYTSYILISFIWVNS